MTPVTDTRLSLFRAEKSRDRKHFDHHLSHVRVRVEHALAHLKNRFTCLARYRGKIYRVDDQITAAEMIQACIIVIHVQEDMTVTQLFGSY